MTTGGPQVPILRWGERYESLDRASVPTCAGAIAGSLHIANAGLIKRDLRRAAEAAAALRAIPVARWLEICAEAGERFASDTLPLGDDEQSPEHYVQVTSATTGLPVPAVREHIGKVRTVLSGMEAVLKGLMRGLDLDALDGRAAAERAGLRLTRGGPALGVVLPSNAPGVNGIWLPALAMKVPVLIKPGRADPWTPFRIVQAFLRSGCPKEAFGFYGADHDGADLLLRRSGAGIVFGGAEAAARYEGEASIEVHGPGRSKVLIGADRIDAWAQHVGIIIDSVRANAGRSCINASSVLVPSRADDLADALAQRLGPIPALPLTDERATIGAFADPAVARAIDARLEAAIGQGGVRDVTAAYRGGPRLAEVDGASYLRPTVLRIDDPDHPLARTELPFIFFSVIEVPADRLADAASGSLVVSALTEDDALLDALARDPAIDRLHVGPRPTTRIDWTSPHEGNLFELLYRPRALAVAGW